MKKQFLILSIFSVLLLSIFFISCEDETTQSEPGVSNNNEELTLKLTEPEPGVNIVFLQGTIRRAIPVRPRDNKVCNCHHCFGICDVHVPNPFKATVDPSTAPIILTVDTVCDANYIYICENESFFESEFGVDNDISVPSEALKKTGMTELTILHDMYTFTSEYDTLRIDNNDYIYYGIVEVSVNAKF